MRWCDVDLDSAVLHVRQTAQRINGKGIIFGPPKSVRSRRDIPIPAVTAVVLHDHLARQQSERCNAQPYWQETGLVFTSTLGTAVEPRNLARVLDDLIKRSGVPRIRVHHLRHTCASMLLAQGVPARVVMEVLGHSQLGVTMNLYAHVMPSALREAADAIDRSLGTTGQS